MEGKSNCDVCKGLIRLCSGLDYFPVDPEVRALLVGRLHHAARDHEHARLMINHWLDTNTAAPKPADLLSLAAEVRAPGQGLQTGCDQCNGEPWVIVEIRGHRYADRCTCARGQALRQMDFNREQAGRRRDGLRTPASAEAEPRRFCVIHRQVDVQILQGAAMQ